MTNDGARRCPGASAQIAPGDLGAADEIDRLTAAYPAFRFSREHIGRHGACWVAERRRRRSTGLHTVITSDLGELLAAISAPPTGPEEVSHAR